MGNDLSNLLRRKYTLPDNCSIKSFVMRELTGEDEVEAAALAEQGLEPAQKSDQFAIMNAERKAAMRLAIVEVNGKPVADGVVSGMSRWTKRTMVFVMNAFNEMNGVTLEELGKFQGEVLGGERTSPSNPSDPRGESEDD